MDLTATNHSLVLETLSAGTIDYDVSWVDIPGSGDADIGSAEGEITTATTTTLVASPASGTDRKVKRYAVTNGGTSAARVKVKKQVGASVYEVYAATLAAGQSLEYSYDGGHRVRAEASVSLGAYPLLVAKTASFAPEAAGIMTLPLDKAGVPGALSLGTPGLNGATFSEGQAGSIILPTGGNGRVVEDFNLVASQACAQILVDLLFANSGLVVTTTTAQALSTVALPPRDINDASLGVGCLWGLYVSASTTNAGAITNTTAQYTNSDGVGSRTATIASFPATCVLNSFIPFNLQSGDIAAQSFQSVTLGTSYGGGAIHLMCIRVLHTAPLVANQGRLNLFAPFKLPASPCLVPGVIPTSGSANSLTGSMVVSVCA